MLKKLLLVCLLIFSGSEILAQNYPPKSSTLVTDSVGILTGEQKQALETKLVAFNDSTTTQIAVVILKTVGNYDINQYGAGLIRNWGIGTKGKNNGILVLVAINDHKVSIQTGYGSEGAVPDIVTHDIITNQIIPNFKARRYYEGLDTATNSLMEHMKGEYKADVKQQQGQAQQGSNDDGGGSGTVIAIIIVVIVVLIIIFRNRGGGGGHIIGRRGGASPFWWFLLGSSMGNNSGGGFFGGDNDSGGSGGFGGSSGGGGDFGGFGGGDSGGGGSSGSW